uniref:Uncharacterized protein n=1 Tax=Chromera velia CCMP2878 TaxID=1169474 RepID=A0A0G4HK50_9ALVE|eukprot:Cvel_7160.t1-p1 / transcript=Cvel_7160.t1 / gene=Cvel_7160 / organism=Chromera_velia_CCMP2878 / gene_product=hypothetical protein / transcript_product=hypothetical protein / location=Cvel_scaffold368:67483-69978(+) / protein_length=832 / sequence_SO=supercontig / SO=protein_coding / is_pseudo=false
MQLSDLPSRVLKNGLFPFVGPEFSLFLRCTSRHLSYLWGEDAPQGGETCRLPETSLKECCRFASTPLLLWCFDLPQPPPLDWCAFWLAFHGRLPDFSDISGKLGELFWGFGSHSGGGKPARVAVGDNEVLSVPTVRRMFTWSAAVCGAAKRNDAIMLHKVVHSMIEAVEGLGFGQNGRLSMLVGKLALEAAEAGSLEVLRVLKGCFGVQLSVDQFAYARQECPRVTSETLTFLRREGMMEVETDGQVWLAGACGDRDCLTAAWTAEEAEGSSASRLVRLALTGALFSREIGRVKSVMESVLLLLGGGERSAGVFTLSMQQPCMQTEWPSELAAAMGETEILRWIVESGILPLSAVAVEEAAETGAISTLEYILSLPPPRGLGLGDGWASRGEENPAKRPIPILPKESPAWQLILRAVESAVGGGQLVVLQWLEREGLVETCTERERERGGPQASVQGEGEETGKGKGQTEPVYSADAFQTPPETQAVSLGDPSVGSRCLSAAASVRAWDVVAWLWRGGARLSAPSDWIRFLQSVAGMSTEEVENGALELVLSIADQNPHGQEEGEDHGSLREATRELIPVICRTVCVDGCWEAAEALLRKEVALKVQTAVMMDSDMTEKNPGRRPPKHSGLRGKPEEGNSRSKESQLVAALLSIPGRRLLPMLQSPVAFESQTCPWFSPGPLSVGCNTHRDLAPSGHPAGRCSRGYGGKKVWSFSDWLKRWEGGVRLFTGLHDWLMDCHRDAHRDSTETRSNREREKEKPPSVSTEVLPSLCILLLEVHPNVRKNASNCLRQISLASSNDGTLVLAANTDERGRSVREKFWDLAEQIEKLNC